MTPVDEPRFETRTNLGELSPDLRRRLTALDEPVARDDWQEVVRRSREYVSWSRRLAVVAVTGVCLAAVALATSRIWPVTRAGVTLAPVASAAGHALYVSPTKEGFCYAWTDVGRGCDPLVAGPLHVTWGDGRVVGTVSANGISTVRIRFTDGTTVSPEIAWISSVRAGFFVYRIPSGKTVAGVNGYHDGRVSRQVTWFSV